MTTTGEIAKALMEPPTPAPQTGRTLSDVLAEVEGRVAAGQPIIEVLPCGWALLDKTVGGAIRKEFIGLIATPAAGKSSLADKVILGALRMNPGTRAAIFALETTPSVRVSRLIAGESVTLGADGISGCAPLTPLLRGELRDVGREHALLTIERLKGELGDRLTFVETDGSASEISRIITEQKPDIILIDHMGLITSDSMMESDTSRLDCALAEITRALRAANAAGILINETNQEANRSKRIDMAASRGSARFASLAAVFVTLEAKPRDDRRDDDRRDPARRDPARRALTVTARLLKNRHGAAALQQQATFIAGISQFAWGALEPISTEADRDD